VVREQPAVHAAAADPVPVQPDDAQQAATWAPLPTRTGTRRRRCSPRSGSAG
jgi:hypothetical protein